MKAVFKHALNSTQIMIPGEDPVAFDQLRADLRTEHRPASTTEEILVDELAQHYWRICRFRRLEAQMWAAKSADSNNSLELDTDHLFSWLNSGFFALLSKSLTAAERNVHRVLATLSKLQKDRGFVPSKIVPEVVEPAESIAHTPATDPEVGFVPVKRPQRSSRSGFVPSKQDHSGARAA